MNNDTRFTSIRQAVLNTAPELGISEPVITKTVVLTRDGYLVGHRLFIDDIQAVWLMKGSDIHFYSSDGSLLKTVKVGQRTPTKKAA